MQTELVFDLNVSHDRKRERINNKQTDTEKITFIFWLSTVFLFSWFYFFLSCVFCLSIRASAEFSSLSHTNICRRCRCLCLPPSPLHRCIGCGQLKACTFVLKVVRQVSKHTNTYTKRQVNDCVRSSTYASRIAVKFAQCHLCGETKIASQIMRWRIKLGAIEMCTWWVVGVFLFNCFKCIENSWKCQIPLSFIRSKSKSLFLSFQLDSECIKSATKSHIDSAQTVISKMYGHIWNICQNTQYTKRRRRLHAHQCFAKKKVWYIEMEWSNTALFWF